MSIGWFFFKFVKKFYFQEIIIKNFQELIQIYKSIKDKIISRLLEFKENWEKGSEADIFAELVFCLLTPQSKAKVCWEVVKEIKKKLLLFSNDKEKLSGTINPVRFKNKKAEYIINAKRIFYINNSFSIKNVIKSFSDNMSLRKFCVEKIKGIGFKEASHFLRNIGFGQNIAILDRHILKNLKLYNVIDVIPDNLSEKKYLEIENKMRGFSKKIGIDIEHLDFVLWYKEAGEVFK